MKVGLKERLTDIDKSLGSHAFNTKTKIKTLSKYSATFATLKFISTSQARAPACVGVNVC